MVLTKLILNSANRTSGTPQKPNFVLKAPGIQATSYQVKKISVPHSFYNITDRNNVIQWTDDTATDQTSTLTNGNYTVSALLTHIGAVMTTDTLADTGTATYSVSSDANTNILTITNNLLANFDIDWSTSAVTQQLAYDLGFYPTPSNQDQGKPTPVDVSAESSHVANNVYWIGAPRSILVKSNLASRAFKPACVTLAAGGGQVGILEELLVDTLSGEITTREFVNPDVVPINPGNMIYELEFELLDQDLNSLDLNGREWSIHIIFDLFIENSRR